MKNEKLSAEKWFFVTVNCLKDILFLSQRCELFNIQNFSQGISRNLFHKFCPNFFFPFHKEQKLRFIMLHETTFIFFIINK